MSEARHRFKTVSAAQITQNRTMIDLTIETSGPSLKLTIDPEKAVMLGSFLLQTAAKTSLQAREIAVPSTKKRVHLENARVSLGTRGTSGAALLILDIGGAQATVDLSSSAPAELGKALLALSAPSASSPAKGH